MDISLRQGKKADYAFLWNLHQSTMKDYVDKTWGWNQGFQKEYFDEQFEPKNIRIIEKDEVSIGVIEFLEREHELCINNVQVDPVFQNKGIGSTILNRIIDDCNPEQRVVKLQVLKVNPAKLFYERLGFEIVGKTKTHFIMEKSLR